MIWRILVLVAVFAIASCSKSTNSTPQVVIPNTITGVAIDFFVTPASISQPDKGSFTVLMANVIYKVDFSAVAQPQSNAYLTFDSDSVLTDASREYANLGKDATAYNPVATNEVTVWFNDGRKVVASFNPGSSFGGDFGEALIATWRTPGDPSKANQKARNDIRAFVKLFKDADGNGPASTPTYLSVQISKP